MSARLISEEEPRKRTTVKMSQMEPCEWGRIINSPGPYNGHLVIRTASSIRFEVMDMTDMNQDACWMDEDASTVVELAKNGEKFTFEVIGQ
jgi:hypothetical protein